jgi:hypothetical protein
VSDALLDVGANSTLPTVDAPRIPRSNWLVRGVKPAGARWDLVTNFAYGLIVGCMLFGMGYLWREQLVVRVIVRNDSQTRVDAVLVQHANGVEMIKRLEPGQSATVRFYPQSSTYRTVVLFNDGTVVVCDGDHDVVPGCSSGERITSSSVKRDWELGL